MLLKFQINTHTKKKIFASYKMFRKGIEILIFVSIILNYQFPKTMFADLFVLILDLIALAHLNSTEKLHRLQNRRMFLSFFARENLKDVISRRKLVQIIMLSLMSKNRQRKIYISVILQISINFVQNFTI